MSILWIILIAGLGACLLCDCFRRIKIMKVELPREANLGEQIPLSVTLTNPRHLFSCHQYLVLRSGPSAEVLTEQEVTLPPEGKEELQFKLTFDKPGQELIQIDGQRYWIEVHSAPRLTAA